MRFRAHDRTSAGDEHSGRRCTAHLPLRTLWVMSTQLSSAVGEAEPGLLVETIGGNFERTVAMDPDREALVDVASGRRWTWAELNRDVDALARG